MEFNQIIEGAGVVAVVFGAVVKGRAVGSERCGDDDTAAAKCGDGFTSQRDRSKQRSVGAGGIEAGFGIAHARNLVARSFNDVSACFNVGAMHCDDLFGRIFKDVGGPERAIDVGAEVIELRGHAAIENVGAATEIFTPYVAVDHVLNGNCLRR